MTYAATATESDKKANKVCWLLNFWTHVPDKAVNIFDQKF